MVEEARSLHSRQLTPARHSLREVALWIKHLFDGARYACCFTTDYEFEAIVRDERYVGRGLGGHFVEV